MNPFTGSDKYGFKLVLCKFRHNTILFVTFGPDVMFRHRLLTGTLLVSVAEHWLTNINVFAVFSLERRAITLVESFAKPRTSLELHKSLCRLRKYT